MTVPDEALEAAAKKLAELNSDAGDQLTDKEWARELIAAAAPFIAAQAWDEGWDAMADFDHRQAGPYPTNPYRSGQ